MDGQNNENGEQFEELAVEPSEDEGEISLPSDGARRIFVHPTDREVESLCNEYENGDLILQPDFQRHFVWNQTKASRLIESALLDIPLPTIYLSEEQDGKCSVIDGQQRLTSFFSFIHGNFLSGGGEFKLSHLQALKDLNGKKFAELERSEQRKIRKVGMRTIVFKKESDSALKFEMFERLNSGSASLNDQELRNCVYRGKYNNLLKELSIQPDFLKLLGLTKPEKRMRDVELVLRFGAFYHTPYLNYRSPMKRFLNEEMKKQQNISDDDAEKLKTAFKNAVSTIHSLLGDRAFKRYTPGNENNKVGKWETQFNNSLYDVLMWQFARVDRNNAQGHLDSLREEIIELMVGDKEFVDAITLSTSSKSAVHKRFDLFRGRIEEIIDVHHREPRCFSYSLKEELFTRNSTCERCGQKIQSIDDSALDHRKQYWKGGQTIPENARLFHRYCNWARPRND